jgi:uncharacterized membrane protein (DUF106 family)
MKNYQKNIKKYQKISTNIKKYQKNIKKYQQISKRIKEIPSLGKTFQQAASKKMSEISICLLPIHRSLIFKAICQTMLTFCNRIKYRLSN